MESGLAWTRRSAGRLAGVHRPIHLPHLEADETGGRRDDRGDVDSAPLLPCPAPVGRRTAAGRGTRRVPGARRGAATARPSGRRRPAPWRDGFFLPRPTESTSARQEPDLLADVVDDLRGEVIVAGPVPVPLGVGQHVDQVLVREAALELVDEGTLNPARVLFYEGKPYSLFADAAGIAATVVSRAGPGRARPVALATPGTAHETKREALWAYRAAGGVRNRHPRSAPTAALRTRTPNSWSECGPPTPPHGAFPAAGFRSANCCWRTPGRGRPGERVRRVP